MALVLALLGLGATACTGNDNGGVITGTTTPGTAATIIPVPATTTTSTTLSGGTLPSS